MSFDRLSRRQFVGGGAVLSAAFVSGCSFSYSADNEGIVRGSETFEFEADEGQEIRVVITNPDPDEEGVSGTGELHAPDGQSLAEVSIDLGMSESRLTSDDATVTAPTSGTYEFQVETNVDRLSITIEVDGEEIVD